MTLFSLHFPLSFCSNLSQALAGALTLGYSNKVLTIFMAVLDEEIDMKKEQIDTERYSSTSKLFQVELGTKLDKLVGSWNDVDLEKIVSYLKEWNTNAKHSFVSQALLNRFVSRFNIISSSIIFVKFIF